MNKSRVCVTKTINLAKDQCVKKTNLLVYEKPKAGSSREPEKPCGGAPHVCAPNAKAIRVCTGAEMKKMCRPRVCVCPPPPPPPWVNILRIIGTTIKIMIAGSIVYWTIFIGMWGDCDSTSDLYYRWCRAITGKECFEKPIPPPPYISASCEEQMKMIGALYTPPKERCSPPPVNLGASLFNMKEKWNHLVVGSFDWVLHFPTHCQNLIDKFKHSVKKSGDEDSKGTCKCEGSMCECNQHKCGCPHLNDCQKRTESPPGTYVPVCINDKYLRLKKLENQSDTRS